MPRLIKTPTVIEAAGKPAKLIEEFIGRVNSADADISIARMKSPAGWSEPPQTPEFDEYTLVLEGTLSVKTEGQLHRVEAGQAIIVRRGERVQYSTPAKGGATYIAVCLPAFTPQTAHREEDF